MAGFIEDLTTWLRLATRTAAQISPIPRRAPEIPCVSAGATGGRGIRGTYGKTAIENLTAGSLKHGDELATSRVNYAAARPVTGGSTTAPSRIALYVTPALAAPIIGASQNSQSC